MGMLTVRNLPEDIHHALRARAVKHGRSTEAEVRAILEQAVKPASRLRMGTALAALGRKGGLTDKELSLIERSRNSIPAEPFKFGS